MEFLQEFPLNITLPPQRPGEDEDSYWERVDYFDTMAGTPPPGFLEKHGFPISGNDLIGIIPCSQTVAKFGPRLKTSGDYAKLMRTCVAFDSIIDVPYFYETMYTDDIYYYLESAWERADIEAKLYSYGRKWAIPGRKGGLLTYSLETDASKLKRLVEKAPYPFIFIVPNEEQDEDSHLKLPPPNTRFMNKLKKALSASVEDDDDDNPRARKRPRVDPNANQASTSTTVPAPGPSEATATTALEAAKRATAAAKEATAAAKEATEAAKTAYLAAQNAEKLAKEATEAAKRAKEAKSLAARLAEDADNAA